SCSNSIYTVRIELNVTIRSISADAIRHSSIGLVQPIISYRHNCFCIRHNEVEANNSATNVGYLHEMLFRISTLVDARITKALLSVRSFVDTGFRKLQFSVRSFVDTGFRKLQFRVRTLVDTRRSKLLFGVSDLETIKRSKE